VCDSKTRKGVVRLTRKGMVIDVLNSSFDMSFYVLYCSKELFMLAVLIRELLALGC